MREFMRKYQRELIGLGGMAAVGLVIYWQFFRESEAERAYRSHVQDTLSDLENAANRRLQSALAPYSTNIGQPERSGTAVALTVNGIAHLTTRGNQVGIQTEGEDTQVSGLIVDPNNDAIGFKLKGETALIYNTQTQELLASVKTSSSSIQYVSGNQQQVMRFAARHMGLENNTPGQRQLLLTESRDSKSNKALYPKYVCEYYELKCVHLQNMANSVAVIVPKEHLKNSGGTYTFNNVPTLKELVPFLTDRLKRPFRKPLNSSQPFANQYALGVGTAFLGTRNRVITAGHCVHGKDVSQYYVVFNFFLLMENQQKQTFSESEVYKMRRIVAHQCNDAADWAVVELDREVTDRKALTRGSGKPKKDTTLYVMGHPCGLPMKIDIGARVKRGLEGGDHRFFANLNTFRGNSGSPVFNTRSGEVEGILVRGAEDFEVDPETDTVVFKVHDIDSEGEGCNTISDVETALRR